MEFKIDEKYAGTRLDKFIRRKLLGLDLNQIYKLISNRKIRVNFEKKRQNYRLVEGDSVSLHFSDFKLKKDFMDLSPELEKEISSNIVFEDENILLFNKPANLVMHKGSGHDFGVSELLKAYTKSTEFSFVNRIDRATSGLIIGTKSLDLTRKISKLVQDKHITKSYYILVEGVVKTDNFILNSWLLKDKKGVYEVDENTQGAKECISHFEIVARGENTTLLKATLETGRTHQLRVQLKSSGHPIIGDSKYGSSSEDGLHLFSYKVVIEDYNINYELDPTKHFRENLV